VSYRTRGVTGGTQFIGSGKAVSITLRDFNGPATALIRKVVPYLSATRTV